MGFRWGRRRPEVCRTQQSGADFFIHPAYLREVAQPPGQLTSVCRGRWRRRIELVCRYPLALDGG